MSTIGNIGTGLFVLIIVWILALIAFVVAVRRQSNFGWIALGTAAILTVALIAIPTEKSRPISENIILEKDYTFIYRLLVLIFLIISIIIGFISFFILHCIEPVRPKPIKSFYIN